jgi:RNA polymerase sigma-70 factor (ECF subfamily)
MKARRRTRVQQATKTGGLSVSAPSSERGELPESALAAARSGDARAFTGVVEHYDRRLRVLAFHLLGDPYATDDALQDVYVKAFRALPNFAGRSSLGTWLTRITYTTCIDHLRRRARLVPVPDLEPDDLLPQGPDPTDELSGRRRVRDALRRLPPHHRAVVVLVGLEGLDYEQAAEILGVPTGTVASRLSTARRILRTALSGDDAPLVAAANEEGSS